MNKKKKLTRNRLQFLQYVKWRRSRTERHQRRRMVLRSRRERWKRCRWWREHEVVVRRMVRRAGGHVKTGVGKGGWRRRRNKWREGSVWWRRICGRTMERMSTHTGRRMKRWVVTASFSCLLPPMVFLLIFVASPVLVVWRKVHADSEIWT